MRHQTTLFIEVYSKMLFSPWHLIPLLMCFSKHWTQELVKMPWPFSESIKKRACRYLLHRYLGNFLQEKLSLDQLSLDLYQGTGSLAQVPLDKWVSSLLMWCWPVFDPYGTNSMQSAQMLGEVFIKYQTVYTGYRIGRSRMTLKFLIIRRSYFRHNPLSLKQVLLDNLVRNTLEPNIVWVFSKNRFLKTW